MDVQAMLPTAAPVRFVAADGTPAEPPTGYAQPSSQRLLRAYRRMLVGRRFDQQAATLVRQGRLAVYPSALGQEACQIGGGLALEPDDWLFPTYRDSKLSCQAAAGSGWCKALARWASCHMCRMITFAR